MRPMRTSSSGLALILWTARSAPRRSSSALSLQPQQHVDDAVDDEAGERAVGRAHQAADELRGEADAAHAAERLQAEDAAGDAAP